MLGLLPGCFSGQCSGPEDYDDSWHVLFGNMGATPKMVGFPNKPMGFPTKNDQHLGCFGGYHHLRKHPYCMFLMYCLMQADSNFHFIQCSGGWLPAHHRHFGNIDGVFDLTAGGWSNFFLTRKSWQFMIWSCCFFCWRWFFALSRLVLSTVFWEYVMFFNIFQVWFQEI